MRVVGAQERARQTVLVEGVAFDQCLGEGEIAPNLGASVHRRAYRPTMPRSKWSDSAILETLAPIVAGLGRMPTRAELRVRGVLSLWDAMRRRGGLAYWAKQVMEPAPPAEAVRERAYLISLDSPESDALSHWLQAEAELGLAA